jgi:hypothetical protein
MAAVRLDPKTTAQVLRTVLKKAFPATKFSIITERGSMVSSVRVKWTDGPAVKEVDALVGPFEMGRFDGMTDSYDYDKTEDRQLLVNGTHYEAGSRYVFTVRHISPELANKCIKQVAEYWGGVEVVPVAVEGYDGFKLSDQSLSWQPVRADLGGNGCGDHYSWISQIRRCAETPSEFTREPVEN